jgi:hypothetical protein
MVIFESFLMMQCAYLDILLLTVYVEKLTSYYQKGEWTVERGQGWLFLNRPLGALKKCFIAISHFLDGVRLLCLQG